MENTADNPHFDPALMQVSVEHTMRPVGLTAVDLARKAAAQSSTSAGGCSVRLEQCSGETIFVPFRGLPENPAGGIFGTLGSWFRSTPEL